MLKAAYTILSKNYGIKIKWMDKFLLKHRIVPTIKKICKNIAKIIIHCISDNKTKMKQLKCEVTEMWSNWRWGGAK